MNDDTVSKKDLGTAEVNDASQCKPAPKWFAVINDQLVPAPQQKVLVRVLKDQGGIPADQVLIRDHGSPDDDVVSDYETVDLAEGNVFYTRNSCEIKPKGQCTALAKLAFVIDDEFEVTLRPNQTGRTLREFFGLTVATRLFRDLESPNDTLVELDAEFSFQDGPVFYTRRAENGLTITVNKQTFGTADGVKPQMTGAEIGRLISDQRCEVKRVSGGAEIVIEPQDAVAIKGCEEFTVIRCNVVGGFHTERLEKELAILRGNGVSVDLVTSPQPSVIYRDIPTRKGYPHLEKTDVLVVIPTAYPGVMLDGAYLPASSPLLGKVAGQTNQARLETNGQSWDLVSYHPHNGGGAPPWNPNRHGVHSYYSELISWIQSAQN
jgi:hypothetical protein